MNENGTGKIEIEIVVKKLEDESLEESFGKILKEKFFDDKYIDEKTKNLFNDQFLLQPFLFDDSLFLKDEHKGKDEITLFIGFSEKGINLNDNDNVKFLFIISFPTDLKNKYLEILGYLKRLLSSKNFKQRILNSKDEMEMKETFEKELKDLET